MTFTADDIECAWAAGFFDGEGYTYVRSARKPRRLLSYRNIVLGIKQSGIEVPEVLLRFQRAIGVGNIIGPYKQSPRSYARLPQWALQVQGGTAERAIARLWPYLGEVKRAQVERCRERIRSANQADLTIIVALDTVLGP